MQFLMQHERESMKRYKKRKEMKKINIKKILIFSTLRDFIKQEEIGRKV
ncbi:hypothetical protein IJD44_07630 [bacterium]|nr:hypothetical protein [bacterium]